MTSPLFRLAVGAVLCCLSVPAGAQILSRPDYDAAARAKGATLQAVTGAEVRCAGGVAAGFPCSEVNLLSFLPIADLGGQAGVNLNDIWGWTDPASGREFALVGRTDGTAFVEVTDPVNPVYLGSLPLHAGARPSVWRDIKVYAGHAYVVADGAGAHGLQVFDLSRLLAVENPPVTFTEDAHYDGFGSAHNLVINEATGFAYAVGLSFGGATCGGGFHIVDIREPKNPQFAGCFADFDTRRGYTHDAQCVLYHGPDAEHRGKEICIGSNEDKITLVDMSDKAQPRVIANAGYPNAAYTHQGWLTEDHRYFLLDDELDERQGGGAGTRTLIWDLTDLDDPLLLTEYIASQPSIDHNQYVRGHYAFQANYTSGLRILDLHDITAPREVAFFDTYAPDDGISFRGAWSVYPFFPSGTLVVSSIGEGLFALRSPVVAEPVEVPDGPVRMEVYPNPSGGAVTVAFVLADTQHVEVAVFDAAGRRVATLHRGVLPAGVRHRFAFDGQGLAGGAYLVRIEGAHFAETRPFARVR
ncbi:choice-of-anchor B family protein [Rhodocaloribacter litoris]|uniref:choice-of-anchor B family protein n=1 Tax=Rhodocaloribacter litoris TaxID=2558931 RepID=UPI00142494C4|nr:choice-of-anchor B family protein [Rhodocaloribacter litoris]QXD13898.1 choice-of-anchor B family protein [Rhodocaloribacter litoris]